MDNTRRNRKLYKAILPYVRFSKVNGLTKMEVI